MNVTIKTPKAIKQHGARKFVGIPIRARGGSGDIEAALYETVIRLAGEGDLVKEDNGVRVLDLVILDGTYDILGDWIVRYSLDSESGACVEKVWIAAEVA